MTKGLHMALCLVAICAGLAGYVADTWLNVEFVSSDKSELGPVITTIVIAVCSALGLSVSSIAFKKKQYSTGILCAVGLVFAILWSAPVSISRISSAIDNQQDIIHSHNERVSRIQQAYNEVKKLRTEESKKGGCGKNCRSLLEKENDLFNQLVQSGSTKTANGGANRLAFVLPYMDAQTVTNLIPFTAVIALTCLMNGLLAFGVTGLMECTQKKKVEIEVPSIQDSDPCLRILKRNPNVSITQLAKLSGNSVPYVSLKMKDMQKKGLVQKARKGRNVRVSLVS